MLRTGNNKDETKVRNLIFEIHDQLRGGVSWDELCMKYSEDQSTRESSGKLRSFGVGAMNSVPQFEQAAFSLETPGDISDPFQTAYGWHIVKLVQKIPVPPLSEIEQSLRTRVSRDQRVQFSRQAAAAKLRRKMGFKENAEVKARVLSLADTSLVSGNWKPTLWKGVEKQELFSTTTEIVTAGDFIKYVVKNQQKTQQKPDQYISQLYDAFVDERVNSQFDEQISKSNPEYAFLLNEYYEGIMLFDIMEKEVWNKASNDSAGQVNFFDTNRSRYTAGERVYGTIYASSKKDLLSPIKDFMEEGDTTQLRRAIESRNVRYETGTFQQSDRPALGKIEWAPGLHEVENGGMYYLVHVEEMVPPGGLTFEEARPAVISDYQEHLEKVWLEKLRKKYPVKINEASKKYIFEKFDK
jgi:peptidyl-prolyl cis-trans isomerase SurA